MKEHSHTLPARAVFGYYPTYRVVSYHKNEHGAVTHIVIQLRSLPLNTKYRFEFRVVNEADQHKLGRYCDRIWQTTDLLILDADDIFQYRSEDVDDLTYLLCMQWPHSGERTERYLELYVESDEYHDLSHDSM